MNKEKSNLIHIPTGTPLWAEPLMKNLYILEEMAKSTGGGEGEQGGNLDDIWIEIEQLQDKHNNDVFDIERQISGIVDIVIGGTNEAGLVEKVNINTNEIANIYSLIEQINGMTIDSVVEEIKKAIEPIEGAIQDLDGDISIAKDDIANIKEKEIELKRRIVELEQTVDEIKNNNKDFHHIVNTEQEMNAITQKSHGSLCFVRSEVQLFIWDGKWTPITPEHSMNKIQWEDITDAPMSQPSTIDTAVSLMHTHSNKTALDTVTFSAINVWDSKADTSQIPTKLSDLENDIGAGGNYDEAIKTIQSHIGNMDDLTTENKASLVEALNEIHAKIISVDGIHRELQELKDKVAYLEK